MARRREGDRYAVLRGTGDSAIEGRWYDLNRLPVEPPFKDIDSVDAIVVWQRLEASQPPRYERREDGQSARVYVPEARAAGGAHG